MEEIGQAGGCGKFVTANSTSAWSGRKVGGAIGKVERGGRRFSNQAGKKGGR